MNILILTHTYPDELFTWRGTFVRDQAMALSRMHDVTVVYFRGDNTKLAPFSKYTFTVKRSDNLTEYIITVPRFFPVINQVKYLLSTYNFIQEHIIRSKRIDVLHSHMSYPAGFLGTIIQKRTGIPNLLTEHSWVKKHFRSRIHKLCVRYALNNTKCIAAVSSALKKDLENYSGNRIEVVWNVVKIERFTTAKNQDPSFLNLGILGGYSNYRKGLDILIRAASLLKDKRVLIHVGGDGSLLHMYRKMALEYNVSDLFRFYGGIDPAELNTFFSSLDLFVLPSRDETFGVVIIEAMACGLPVISTYCGGPDEIITPENGILVPVEDPKSLASAIERAAMNLKYYKAEEIRKFASLNFGEEAFLERINPIYKSCILK